MTFNNFPMNENITVNGTLGTHIWWSSQEDNWPNKRSIFKLICQAKGQKEEGDLICWQIGIIDVYYIVLGGMTWPSAAHLVITLHLKSTHSIMKWTHSVKDTICRATGSSTSLPCGIKYQTTMWTDTTIAQWWMHLSGVQLVGDQWSIGFLIT